MSWTPCRISPDPVRAPVSRVWVDAGAGSFVVGSAMTTFCRALPGLHRRRARTLLASPRAYALARNDLLRYHCGIWPVANKAKVAPDPAFPQVRGHFGLRRDPRCRNRESILVPCGADLRKRHRYSVAGARWAHRNDSLLSGMGFQMGFDSGYWSCAICGRGVSRLVGMEGTIELPGCGLQMRRAFRGYCLAHRETVRSVFREDLKRWRELASMADTEVEPSARDAEASLARADRELWNAISAELGVPASLGGCSRCGADTTLERLASAGRAEVDPHWLVWECLECDAGGPAYVL